jgi:ubiquinone/menaquinone biosynthesis C-methylase UbiE
VEGVVKRHFLQGEPHPESPGVTIGHGRAYEVFGAIGFAGRRRRVFTRLVELSGAGPGDRVLDVGCGPGYLTRLAARAVAPGGTVLGVDASASVIEYARRVTSAGNCAFEVGLAERLDAADESFDVVVSSLMVHHLPAELRPAAVAEMARVLRPGGRLLIADFRPPRGWLGRYLVDAVAGPAMSHNPIDQLEPLVRDAGLPDTTTGELRPFLFYVRATKS